MFTEGLQARRGYDYFGSTPLYPESGDLSAVAEFLDFDDDYEVFDHTSARWFSTSLGMQNHLKNGRIDNCVLAFSEK